ncbi:serine/threonine protein kinase [Candidatus Bathyarchaeota archaeon]|nr:MAG: serine/threonine protein kinase [Candidatus Bathyarchaeota archaeon]
MSSAEKAASILPKLEPEDLRVLQAVELGMADFEYVPLDHIIKYANLNPHEVEFRIGELNKKDLLYGQPGPYRGYILNYAGYDCLALNALVKADALEALGRPLGVGKEADVYEALTPDGSRVAVKFHRLGRTSFRETRRKRGYVADRRHVSWLYQSRLAAEREFEALRRVHSAGVSVPEPLHRNRHMLVMSYIDGYNLADVDSLDDPEGFLDDILRNVGLALSAGVIHTDLSEFNIVVQKDGEVLLIDWPQFVSRDHPNAEAILRRDLHNVLRYFKRKFGVERSLDEALTQVKGGA